MVSVPTSGEILFAHAAKTEALQGDLLGGVMHCRFQDSMAGLEASWRRCSKPLALSFGRYYCLSEAFARHEKNAEYRTNTLLAVMLMKRGDCGGASLV